MEVFFGHATALALYDSGALTRPGHDRFLAMPPDHVPHATDAELSDFAKKWALPLPLCAVVPSRDSRRRKLRLHCVVNAHPALQADYCLLSGQMYVATPELALLQVEPDMDFLALVALVSQLCSRFTISPESPHGFVQRDPVTSKSLIFDFLDKAPGLKGAKTLRLATHYAVENARSPAEVKTPLRLLLPRKFYGYGILPPVVNARIDLKVRGMSRLSSREVDFLWESAKLIGEYNSDEFHGEKTMKEDARRANELVGAGYTIMNITADQVGDDIGMDRLAASIAAHVYACRTAANRQAMYAFILQPDKETREGRARLKRRLNELYGVKLWTLPLRKCQQSIINGRNRRNEQRKAKKRLDEAREKSQ